MKKVIFFLLTFLLTANAFAQKQSIAVDKNDTIRVHDKPYAMVEKRSGVPVSYRVKSLEGKDLVDFQVRNITYPNGTTNSFFEITFLNDGQKCEKTVVATKKGIAKMLVENELLKYGEIDSEKERIFVSVNGMQYSNKLSNWPRQGGNVIIINK